MKGTKRMIRAWLNGEYKTIPWRSICILGLVALYAINPFDLIPDYIPIVGVIDDAAVLGFLWRSVKKDAGMFLEWESRQREALS